MALAPDAHFEAKDDKQFRRRRDGGGRYHRGATTLRLATQLARGCLLRRRGHGGFPTAAQGDFREVQIT